MGIRIVLEDSDHIDKKIIIAEVSNYSWVWYQVDHLARRIFRLLEKDKVLVRIDNGAPYKVYKDEKGKEVMIYI
jgi:hypothetical protein